MQELHMSGFLNRVVYNGCKAYVSQLKKGEPFSSLNPVIAISICDFELWPNKERIQAGLDIVPLISHWSMTEKASKAEGLQQVRYTFVELPKVSLQGPWNTVGETWAWLFRVGEFEGEIPSQATLEQQATLQLANEATWKQGEREAYDRVYQEIDQARQLMLDSESKGREAGRQALKRAILMLCEVLAIPVNASQQRYMERASLEKMESLIAYLKEHRTWPSIALSRTVANEYHFTLA
jgi:hypothetical protein